jgi:hypothetical protein
MATSLSFQDAANQVREEEVRNGRDPYQGRRYVTDTGIGQNYDPVRDRLDGTTLNECHANESDRGNSESEGGDGDAEGGDDQLTTGAWDEEDNPRQFANGSDQAVGRGIDRKVVKAVFAPLAKSERRREETPDEQRVTKVMLNTTTLGVTKGPRRSVVAKSELTDPQLKRDLEAAYVAQKSAGYRKNQARRQMASANRAPRPRVPVR